MSTVARSYAAWSLGLSLDDVPTSALTAAKRHLLDGIGCALAAVREDAAPYALDVARALAGPAEATIMGTGVRVSAPAAALANGMLVHALDFDDTHADALVHATAAVLPAALASGEERGARGDEALVAAIAGYELVTRLGAGVRHGFHARGFHATSVCGVFASAMIASRLMGLDVEHATNALGIAGSLAGGSLEFLATGAATKQMHPGFAGSAGILSARLAAAGAEGPDSIFEGAYGFFRAYAGVPVDPAVLTEGLGSRWEVERITIKPYPACQLSHASLDALRDAGVGSLDIDSIMFDVPAESVPIICEPAEQKRLPRTPYEAKFSLPYCAAALLVDGTLGLDSFDPERIARPDVRALASRVGYRQVDPGAAAAEAPGRVLITFTDGTSATGDVKQSRGGPADPLTDEELRAKFIANDGTVDLAERVLGIEQLEHIEDLWR